MISGSTNSSRLCLLKCRFQVLVLIVSTSTPAASPFALQDLWSVAIASARTIVRVVRGGMRLGMLARTSQQQSTNKFNSLIQLSSEGLATLERYSVVLSTITSTRRDSRQQRKRFLMLTWSRAMQPLPEMRRL